MSKIKNRRKDFASESLKKTSLLVLVYLFGFLSYVYIGYKIFEIVKLGSVVEVSFNKLSPILILCVSGLMYINWYIEALKWRKLIAPIQAISNKKAYRSVLAGLNFGLISPNRIGEPLGRVLYTTDKNKTSALLAAIIGSLFQLSITLIMGIVALILSLTYLQDPWGIIQVVAKHLSLTALCFTMLLVLSYLVVYLIKKKRSWLRIRFIKKLNEAFSFLKKYPKKYHLLFFFLSLFRYIVFVTQLLLLLKLCNVDVPVFTLVICICLMYLLVASLPRNTLTELGVRGSVLLALMTEFTTNQLGVFMAISGLWIVNIGIPALIGGIFIFTQKHVETVD